MKLAATKHLPARPRQRYQANKRKLFEKAQLKRQYAKLLKKEAATAGGEHEAEAAQSDAVAGAGGEEPGSLSPKRKRKEEAKAAETKQRRAGRDGREEGQREQGKVKEGGQQQGKPGKWKRPEHRPDPFKAAKVKSVQESVSTRATTAAKPGCPCTPRAQDGAERMQHNPPACLHSSLLPVSKTAQGLVSPVAVQRRGSAEEPASCCAFKPANSFLPAQHARVAHPT